MITELKYPGIKPGDVLSQYFISNNFRIKEVFGYLNNAINSDSSILITGETGAGKELLAEFVHHSSGRRNQPFIKVGLSAIPAELLESELFGHERGAYTSANTEKRGLFELANHGSIFLDDIDDFPLMLQSKLLRVLESREMMRIGGEKYFPIDIRLVTASKADLRTLVNQGKFRADLYYRINVVPVNIPPLRERSDDIPLLVRHFIKLFAPGRQVEVTSEAMMSLIKYQWPGNVRELKNVIERTILFCNSKIDLKILPHEIINYNPKELIAASCIHCVAARKLSFREVVECLEFNLIQQALDISSGNKLAAAGLLSLPLSTFNDKLKKYKINYKQYRKPGNLNSGFNRFPDFIK